MSRTVESIFAVILIATVVATLREQYVAAGFLVLLLLVVGLIAYAVDVIRQIVRRRTPTGGRDADG